MALTPIQIQAQIPTTRKKRRKLTRRGRIVKTPKSPEVKYRRELQGITVQLRQDINTRVIPILRQFESEYVNDAYAATLANVFENLRVFYKGLDDNAKIVASSFTSEVNSANKDRFYAAMEEAVGVNLSTIVQNEGLDDILTATTRENVSLIRSIPEEYFKKIENAVFTGTTQGSTAGGIIKQLQEIGKVTTQRAKLIARDQSSKLNSALNQQRQQNLGVEEYIWRTSSDERVRETHRSKNGKKFRWDDPPKDTGHPGQDIQCRCVAQPIINI